MEAERESNIYLLRHAETAWNVLGLATGHLESPLTPEGRSQAARVGGMIRKVTALNGDEPIVVTSASGRAQETGIIIAKVAGLLETLAVDERLNGVDAGSWDGRSRADVAREHPSIVALPSDLDWFFASPDGETYERVFERTLSWFRDAKRRPRPRIVVTHGITGRVLRGISRGLDRPASLALEFPRESVFVLSGAAERVLTPDPGV